MEGLPDYHFLLDNQKTDPASKLEPQKDREVADGISRRAAVYAECWSVGVQAEAEAVSKPPLVLRASLCELENIGLIGRAIYNWEN